MDAETLIARGEDYETRGARKRERVGTKQIAFHA